jgi:hypothetical protein
MKNSSDIDLSKFKPEAAIDFVRIQFQTASRTNMRTVQQRVSRILNLPEGKKASIDVLDETVGRSASVFACRVQDPKNFEDVARVLDALTIKLALIELPRITAIEVAFDLKRRKGTTVEALSEAVAHQYKFSSFRPSRNQRIYRGKNSAQAIPARMSTLVRDIAAGYCIGVGSQRSHASKLGNVPADPVSIRYYLKRTDDSHDLPEDEWRVRMEVTIQGDALPFKTLDELACFDFEHLRDMFSFRRMKDSLSPLSEHLCQCTFSDLSKHKRIRRGGGTRLHHPDTRANSELNELVRRGFRSLTKRWAKKPICGNLVNSELMNRLTVLANVDSANNYI